MTTAAATRQEVSEHPVPDGGRAIRFGLYAEVNMNLIDGSSVWVQSVSQTLARIPGVDVTLLLRAREERDVLTAPLHANGRIELVRPEVPGHEKPLDVGSALDELERLDEKQPFDVVLLRGAG